MRPNQPRQKCDCGLTFRYDSDFQEHKRVGCLVESGKGDSLSADPDEAPIEAVVTEAPTEAVTEQPKKQSRKK
jgi:hypothetical protein